LDERAVSVSATMGQNILSHRQYISAKLGYFLAFLLDVAT
jgi:hypothetical protein